SGTCCSVLVSGSGRHLRVSIWRSGHAVRPGGDVAAVDVVAEALREARLISGAGAWVFWGDREHGALVCGEVPSAGDGAGAGEPFADGGVPGGDAAGHVQCEDARAVRAEGGESAGVVGDTQRPTQRAQIRCVPEADRAVVASAEDDPAVRCEGDRVDEL